MSRVNIKPLSVNKAWRGRRFKTSDYEIYEKELYYLLPNIEVSKGKLKLNIEFGLSSKGSDIDNCLKQFIDVCQKKYLFNDNRIYKLTLEKVDVKKGEEYIDFLFNKL